MRPVDQTRFGAPDGNCMEACVASILELELGGVPDLAVSGDDWHDTLADFLARFDLEPLELDARKTRGIWVPTGFHIISGKSPRGNFLHAVVGLGGKMVHDPHPNREGLAKEEQWIVFVVRFLSDTLNPAKVERNL